MKKKSINKIENKQKAEWHHIEHDTMIDIFTKVFSKRNEDTVEVHEYANAETASNNRQHQTTDSIKYGGILNREQFTESGQKETEDMYQFMDKLKAEIGKNKMQELYKYINKYTGALTVYKHIAFEEDK